MRAGMSQWRDRLKWGTKHPVCLYADVLMLNAKIDRKRGPGRLESKVMRQLASETSCSENLNSVEISAGTGCTDDLVLHADNEDESYSGSFIKTTCMPGRRLAVASMRW